MITRLAALLLAAGVLVGATAQAAHAQFFGRNKVQYRAFDFKIIKTEHFDIYFYPQERDAALQAARMLERGYARMSRILQHEFEERKPAILYASHSDFQQTNATQGFIDESTGAFVEPFKTRLVIPMTGDMAHFERVLLHELAHVFQFDVIFRRAALSEANPFGGQPPLWFMEGMAEYLALGRIDPHTASWLRDAALAGYLRSIAEMNVRHDYLSYRFGQSLWAYIGSKWGDEVIGILLQKAPRVGIPRAFASTLGISLEELSQEWREEVRKAYLPQVVEYRRPEEYGRRLTDHAELGDPWYIAPAVSPDGKDMVLVSQEGGFSFDLWLADAETGELKRRLIESSRDADFESLRYMNSSAAFSPDGRFVAFSAQTGGRDVLYVLNVRERKIIERLRFDLNGISNPSWAPDGQHIVFTGLDGGVSDLFVTDLEGNLRRLTDDFYADLLPAWSPDGRRIAFSTDRGPETDWERLVIGNHRVALYDLETGEIEVLPHQETGNNTNPAWSPDGGSLVWVSDRTGTFNLYLYDLADRQLSRITDLLSGVIAITPLTPAIAWSQQSGKLLFVHFESAGYNLYSIADPRTLPRTPVAELPREPQRTPVANLAPRGVRVDTISLGLERKADLGGIASFYREADQFRASAALPEGALRERPVSVVALLDSATMALPDTTEFEIRDYNVKFSPDMIGRPTIGAQVGGYYGNGVYGGSYIALSDMLGNHNILLAGNVNGSFSDAQVFAGYNFLKTRANFGVAVQQLPLYRYLGTTLFGIEGRDGRTHPVLSDVFLRDVIRSVQGMTSYPFSTFRRIELGASATQYKRDLIYRGVVRTTGERYEEDRQIGSLAFIEPTAALVFDNALFGWTGPITGRRYRLQMSRTFGDFAYTEALVDFRNYLNFKQRLVLASRFVTLARLGDDADRFLLYWGGPYFIRGYDGDSFSLTGRECIDSRFYGDGESIAPCPVRDQLIGSSAAFMNMELRFPIITELQIGFLGNFPPVDAVAFFDGGMAWNNSICTEPDPLQPTECAPGKREDVRLVWDRQPGQDPYLVREPLFSYGLGLRINVFYTVLRLDYAWPLNRPDGSPIFSVSFGPSF